MFPFCEVGFPFSGSPPRPADPRRGVASPQPFGPDGFERASPWHGGCWETLDTFLILLWFRG